MRRVRFAKLSGAPAGSMIGLRPEFAAAAYTPIIYEAACGAWDAASLHHDLRLTMICGALALGAAVQVVRIVFSIGDKDDD